MKALAIIICTFVLFVVPVSPLFAEMNQIQRDGTITFDVLKAPVKIIRDEKGVPYIYADSLADGITAQGFITAQDRLTQLEVIRLFSNGRYSELVGKTGLKQDVFFRSIGFLRNARKHAKILDAESRQFIQWYVNGINAYIEKMVAEGKSKWFDDKGTSDVETMNDIIHKAGQEAISQYGAHPKWGDLHQFEIHNALITAGPLKEAADAGKYPMSGSGETLYRAKYHYDHPFDIYYTASLRVVADLSDKDKVLAVLPGGVSGRIGDKHYKDQVGPFMSGKKLYWWFSDKMIKAHTASTLTLNPGK